MRKRNVTRRSQFWSIENGENTNRPLYELKSETIDLFQRRPCIIDLLFIILICCTFTVITSGRENITIMNRGSKNAIFRLN